MRIFEKRLETTSFIEELKKEGKTVGFVPTMGALHKAHLDLVKRSIDENDYTAVSIFVNPIQFNNREDLEKYPRTLEGDIEKLKSVGCDLLFNPTVEEMYPEAVTVKYSFGNLDKVLEGKFRPGHFHGVAVVVQKLFEIVIPNRAYFGRKDYQQLKVVQALVNQQNIPVEVVPCPTTREPDGLAMSSRNVHLSKTERQLAPFIYETLKEVKKKSFTLPVEEIRRWAVKQFESRGVFKLEYFELVDEESFMPVDEMKKGNKYVACVAAWLGNVRLIDNIVLI